MREGPSKFPDVSDPRTARISLLSAALLAAACAGRAPVEPPPPAPSEATVCHDCFWEHQPEGLREELLGVYRTRTYADPLLDAERRLLVGRVANDRDELCAARRVFAETRDEDPDRALLAAETAAFLAEECGADPVVAFTRASLAARAAADAFKANAYREIAAGRFAPRFGTQEIGRSLDVPEGARALVLGVSSIRVLPGSKVAVQAERTVRDWLSYQLSDDFSASPPPRERIVGWHEGARLADLIDLAGVEPRPVRGTLAVFREGRWLVPDESGVFRFEVLPDKVQYPTTRTWRDLALLVDTHGVAAIERGAARSGASLVLACGDHPSKMEAAYRLASEGVSVWFPCDRFVGEILGHDARGVLLGSAPVRAAEGGAVIGDTPVIFRFDETIVVEDTDARGVSQYHDAAARYFRALGERVPLRLEFVLVSGPGDAARVVERARALRASAVALRIATPEDGEVVRAWLSGSKERRAVLFHSVPYPTGVALFREFPGQTTFGDPRPSFLLETGARAD